MPEDVAGPAFSEEFTWRADSGEELVGRLEVREVSEERQLGWRRPAERAALAAAASALGVKRLDGARPLAQWVSEFGWTVCLTAPDGCVREVPLATWREWDPDKTWLRVAFVGIARWLYERHRSEGKDPYNETRIGSRLAIVRWAREAEANGKRRPGIP